MTTANTYTYNQFNVALQQKGKKSIELILLYLTYLRPYKFWIFYGKFVDERGNPVNNGYRHLRVVSV